MTTETAQPASSSDAPASEDSPKPLTLRKGVELARFQTDRDKEKNGTWVIAAPGLKLLIARVGNPKYQAALMKDGKFFGRGLKVVGTDAEELEALMQKAISQHVLLGWEGLLEGDEPVPFSPKKALQIFEEYPEFYRLVFELASDIENFRLDAKEEAVKN